MAVGDIFLVTVVQDLHGQTCLNTCHYRETVSAGAAGAATLGAGIDGRIAAGWRPSLSDEWEYIYTQTQKIAPGTPEYPVTVATGGGLGAVVGASVNTSTAIVFTKRTALAGRKYRGRFYVTGFPVAYLDESELTPAGVAAMGPLGAALVGAFTGGGYTFEPVLYHRNDGTNTPIVAPVLRSTVRNQRRRQLRIGI